MTTTTRAAANGEASSDLQTMMSDIATLRHDLATLAGHIKSGAVDGASDAAQGAVRHIGAEASRVYESLSAQGTRSAKAIGRQVEERPVAILLLAFALGFIGSRLLSR